MFSLLKPVIYIQIAPERITLKNINTGEIISEVPEIAISDSPKQKILGIGNQARLAAAGQSAKVTNPFAHPRSLVSDFTVADQLLKAFVRQLTHHSIFSFSPAIVIHPLGEPLGGYTQIEYRVFRELAACAGASEIIVCVGRNLTDQEILSRNIPTEVKT